MSSALDTSVGIRAGLALAAALPELPYACGLATVGLLAGDVVAEPLLPVDGALPVRARRADPDLLAPLAAPPDRAGRVARARARRCWELPGRLDRMNPSTALARVLVDELVRGGVREAVLSPGSRSAPLAFALHDADAAGRLRLHVRIDERSAAFLALGLAKASGAPVPVVTTSGTATANLHPAVLEADASGVPLLLLTADRPPELRGTGANQTVDQLGLYGARGAAVRRARHTRASAPATSPPGARAPAGCSPPRSATSAPPPGPVHVNLGLREPLVPGRRPTTWVEPLDGRAGRRALDRARARRRRPAPPDDDLPARTVVVLGDGPRAQAAAALALARRRGWPVVAEPSSGARADAGGAAAARAAAVAGRLGRGRTGPTGCSSSAGRRCRAPSGGWPPARRATSSRASAAGPTRPAPPSRVLPAVPAPAGGDVDPDWLDDLAGRRAPPSTTP